MRLTSATIISNSEIRPGLHLLRLHSPYLAQAAQPGQYAMVRCCDALAHDPLLRRPFFIAATQNEQCSMLVAARGRGSMWLARQPEEAMLDMLGPLGHGWGVPATARNLLLIGEGALFTSLPLLAQRASEQELAITLLCSFASDAEIYPPALLSPEIEYVVATPERGSKPLADMTGDYLAWADTVYFAVSLATAHTLYQRYELLRRKHRAQCLVTSPFACANGVCLTCAINTRAGSKMVCRDGPVFDLRDVVFE